MTFLAPLFLLALPLLAIPIVLHLWRKRRRETVGWGAMQFLFQDDHQQRRFSNIDKWLVLLARCLLLLLLIFALARPLLNSERYGSLESRTEDILVLDQSLSASALDANGKPFIDTMREQAKQWVQSRPRGASVRVLTTAGRPQWLSESGGDRLSGDAERAVLMKQLDSIRPVAARSDLAASIRFAVTTKLQSDENAADTRRRVWVLTDGRASDWRFDSNESVAGFCQSLEQASAVEIHLGMASQALDRRVNVSVDQLTSIDWRKARGERLEVTTRIVNRSTRGSPPTEAIWSLGGKIVSRSPVKALGPGESETVQCSLVVQDPGTQTVACQLHMQDSMLADNQSEAVVQVLDRIPVLIVSDRKPSRSRLGAADFLAAALGERRQLDSDNKRKRNASKNEAETEREHESLFHVERATGTELSKKTLDDYDAVVWMDAASPSKATMQRLTDHVRGGGGLWLVLGDETEVETFNRDWYAGSLGLSPVVLKALEIVDVKSDNFEDKGNAAFQSDETQPPDSLVHPPTRDHPMVQWLAESSLTDLDQVLIERFYSVTRPGSESAAQTILRTGGGNPLSLLSNYGKGRVAIQTVAMHPSWTNWPLTGSFVVMTDSWLRHLTAPRQSIANVDLGTPLETRVPSNALTKPNERFVKSEVVTPSGAKVAMATRTGAAESSRWRYPSTFEAGVYTVAFPITGDKPNATKRVHFAVGSPAEESELQPLAASVSKQLASVTNTSVYDLSKNASDWVEGTGGGKSDPEITPTKREIPKLPIWTPLLYGLLAFLVLELVLAAYASVRRFGRVVMKPLRSAAAERESSGDPPSLDLPTPPPVPPVNPAPPRNTEVNS